MVDETDLVGKKKVLVDASAFVNIYRHPEGYSDENSSLAPNVPQKSMFDGVYLSLPSEVDKVRAYIGKNWDHRKKQPAPEASSIGAASESQLNEPLVEKQFDNNWGSINLFLEHPLKLDVCDPSPKAIDWQAAAGPVAVPKIDSTQDKITLECNPIAKSTNTANWVYFVKTGIVSQGASYSPVVDTTRFFYDHYHETHLPFTPDELISKQPVGKSYFADFKTSYSERIRSNIFEDVTGLRDDIQNSMPTPYGFLNLITNQALLENESFDLSQLLVQIQAYFTKYDNIPEIKKGIYNYLLAKFPLETLVTLYGVLILDNGQGNNKSFKIIEKLITLDHEKHDVKGLFETYLDSYSSVIGASPNPDLYSDKFGNIDDFFAHIRALENKFRTLIFSPDVIPIMDKVEKYKKLFPFSVELEFGAKLSTSLGDSMKKFFMTRFMSHVLASKFSRLPNEEEQFFPLIGGDMFNQGALGFINYTQEDIYKVLDNKTELEYSLSPSRSGVVTKPVTSLTSAVWEWLQASNFYQEYKAEENTTEIRNYTTFFKHGTDEPVNLDTLENTVFKKLFGSAFYGKIADIYNQKGRTYQQILDGVPAYTEDLFYRIKKERKLTNEGSEWQMVQNILIPNTSDLDIAKYVDTQLKYSSHATYRYTVYTHRVVFGSAYRYHWPDQDNGLEQPDGENPYGPANPLNTASDGPQKGSEFWFNDITKSEDTTGGVQDIIDPFTGEVIGQVDLGTVINSSRFTATFNVRVHPSIQIIEDKLFETPEILVMDRPPVRPDINIIPYRAVNNRVKMLLTGNVDRSREKPIIILESDKEEFKKVEASQLSFDGKVEFASDDSVQTFQIFRILEKPTVYSDFSGALYKELDSFVFEEKILPNTKYYYTFRAKDPHGHVSNPTEVYEVELIDEKGAVKPIIRLVSMEPAENKTNIKECQKYIYVKPALKQLYFSEDPEVDSIFSQQNKKKKYKMRITSKGSGKKIDINFSFIKKQSD